MKLIILNGSSCSGKSTIIKNIMAEKSHCFHINRDSIKWSFSKYQYDKDHENVQKILLAIADTVFKIGYNTILDFAIYKKYRQEFIDLAKEYNYELLEINLEADYEILLKRFNERIKSVSLVQKKDRIISNTSVDRFKEIFDIFNKEKNPLALTIRTDTQNVENVSKSIMKFL